MQAKQDTHSELFSHHRSSLKWTWHPFRLVRFAVPCAAKESSDDDVDVDPWGLLKDPQRGSSLCCKVHNHNRWSESARFELTSGSHYIT
jgi:hypothetical protein